MATKKATSKKTPAKAGKTNLPAAPIDFAGDAGAGMEGADKESFAIPFLRVIQKTSPQVDEAAPEYDANAAPGMLLNTVTGRLYDGKKKGVTFLPCAFQRRFLLWAPRNEDGGFGGEYLPEDVAALRAEGKAVLVDGALYQPDDNGKVNPKKSSRYADTRGHFGLLVEDGKASPVLLSLVSTQIKKSKQLMSILTEARVETANGLQSPPTWMSKIKITTVLESNDQGSWYGVRFEADGFIEDGDLYAAGKAFHDQIIAGEAKANYEPAEGEEADGKF